MNFLQQDITLQFFFVTLIQRKDLISGFSTISPVDFFLAISATLYTWGALVQILCVLSPTFSSPRPPHRSRLFSRHEIGLYTRGDNDGHSGKQRCDVVNFTLHGLSLSLFCGHCRCSLDVVQQSFPISYILPHTSVISDTKIDLFFYLVLLIYCSVPT